MASITFDKITGSICQEEIPASAWVKAANGKHYLNFEMIPLKEADKFGKTITVTIGQTKQEREEKTAKVYIGKAKEFLWDNNNQHKPAQTPQQRNDNFDSDLGF